MCLLISLNAAPPDLESLGPLSFSSKLKVEEWKSIACARWSTVGQSRFNTMSLRIHMCTVRLAVDGQSRSLWENLFGRSHQKSR